MTSIESGFRSALAKFSSSLTPREVEEFRFTTLEDVQKVVVTIQHQQARRKEMMNLTRIQSFLEAMKSFGEVIEVFLNLSEFIPFIWGPIKFLLQVASSWTESFDTLLGVYQQLAESIPLLNQYRALFVNNSSLGRLLEMVYTDILDFHRCALIVFRKPKSLRRHGSLVESQANIIQIQNYQAESVRLQATLTRLEDTDHKEKTLSVLNWLSSADVNLDQENYGAVRDEDPNSALWILHNEKIRTWANIDSALIPCLWLNGIPGAGKTILASRIIEQCQKMSSASVLFFYCKHLDNRRNSFLALARSILTQLLGKNTGLIPYFYDRSIASSQTSLNSNQLCKELLEVATKCCSKTYIIIDGIDECDIKERKMIISFFTSLVDTQTQPGSLRSLFVSQDENDIKNLLATASVIRVSSDDNKADIERFAGRWAFKIIQKFELAAEVQDFITKTVTNRSDGMFLFAKLVLTNLYGQTTRDQLLAELQPDKFPRGLDQAKLALLRYGRILYRIIHNEITNEREQAQKLLSWMVCSKRPLKWHEIQGAMSIDISEESIDFDARQLRIQARDLCGSLVEMCPGDRVEFVHNTARIYLIQERYVEVALEEQKLALLCLRYLTFGCFDRKLSESDLSDFVVEGYYAFQDYATLHWLDHLESLYQTQDQSGITYDKDLIVAVKEFSERYVNQLGEREETPEIVTGYLNNDGPVDYLSPLLAETKGMRAQDETLAALGPLGDVVKRVRSTIEQFIDTANHDAESIQDMNRYYGLNWYKCPKHPCFYFHEGFHSAELRDRHTERHERPYCCTEPGCPRLKIGFVSEKELKKHVDITHPNPEALSWKFSKVGEKQHQNNSSFFCNKCLRMFTRASTLRIHLRTHTNERPYVCGVCGKAFTRKGDCARHESLHSGEKNFVCGGKLLSGGSWGCGRRFSWSDYLAEHLKSGFGRKCIQPLREEEAAQRQQNSESIADRVPPEANDELPAASISRLAILQGLDLGLTSFNEQGEARPMDHKTIHDEHMKST
ncbi:MAG: hypothetical protein Q9195_006873 [Heterodermia aff. obscurata]